MAFGFAQPTTGLIAGLIAQPEARNRFTIDFARAYADAVTVLVHGQAADAWPVTKRVAWLRMQFPDVEVVEVGRSASRLSEPSSNGPLDRVASAALLRRRFDLLFSPNAADKELAAQFGARSVPCFPAAALEFADPAPDEPTRAAPQVQRLLRVCLFGPESTGKTTLATQLARHYRSAYAADYVRGYLDAIGSTGTLADVPWIARGQLATEAAAAAQADRVLVSDTSLAAVALWSDVLYGATPDWIQDQACRQRYDLWLLTDIDVPFAPDPLRCFPETTQRAKFMERCRLTLDQLGVEPVVVRGTVSQRLALARAAIDRMLSAHA